MPLENLVWFLFNKMQNVVNSVNKVYNSHLPNNQNFHYVDLIKMLIIDFTKHLLLTSCTA